MTDLSGKIALITGASKGIGAAVAIAYAQAGAHVILLARNKRKLTKIDDKIKKIGGKATLIPCDLNDHDALKNLAPLLQERFGKLDIFVGNAGVLGTLSPLQDTSVREFNQVMNVNLTTNFILLKTLHPLLKQSDSGRVILVSTAEDVVKGSAYWGSYAISKSALETMARVYAEENKQSNIRINLLDPVKVRTDMRVKAKPGEDPMSLKTPEDITGSFLMLASNDCIHHGEVIKAQ